MCLIYIRYLCFDKYLPHVNIRVYSCFYSYDFNMYAVEPLLKSHPDEMPPSLERPLDNENLNIT